MKLIIIGAGIVGLAIARELARKGYKDIVILEKESEIASHQSSRNSGVMHAGLYYKPGSLKAKFSREGINLMKSYCNEHSISWEECGKIVVAKSSKESERLNKLFERGKRNNLKGISKLSKQEILQKEPYVNCSEGILVPEESIVNYKEVAQSYFKEIKALGVELKFNSEFKELKEEKSNLRITLKDGSTYETDNIISSSGLYSDLVAKNLGIDIDNQKILPFRGEYYLLKKEYSYLVNGLIYPIPNPEFPFLGVHFTKMINGMIEAGPNAVLALAREGYDWGTINLGEFAESITFSGLRNFILKYPFITIGEIARSLSKELFVNSLKELIPDIKKEMLVKSPAGIRAQLMNKSGDLIQDFDIRVNKNVISILNAPSPAATSSLAIAKYVVKYLDL